MFFIAPSMQNLAGSALFLPQGGTHFQLVSLGSPQGYFMGKFSPLTSIQSVNFGRHLTEILYPFEISYQIFIHTLPYQYLSFRNFTLPKFSFEKSYLTKIFFSEMLRNFTIIKVSVNRLYVNVTLRKLR